MLLLFLGMSCFPDAAWSWATWGPGRLDRLLATRGWHADAVVLARVDGVHENPEARVTRSSGPRDIRIHLTVRSVILGTGVERALTVPLGGFCWPREFVPLETAQTVLLFLRGDSIRAVLPTLSKTLPAAKDRFAARRIVADDLLTTLAGEASAFRRRCLLVNVEPILDSTCLKRVVPYLKDADKWVRSAALAAVVRIEKAPKRIERAAEEIRKTLRTAPVHSDSPTSFFFNLTEGQSGPVAMLLEEYHYVSGVYDAAPDPAFRPLMREFVRSGREWPNARWEFGVLPLCRVGTIADVDLLHGFYREQFVLEGGPEHAREQWDRHCAPDVRREVLLGLARILDVRLPELNDREFVRAESEQYKVVFEAMNASGHPVPR